MGAIPGLDAVAAEDSTAGPTFQTGHAHGGEVARLAFALHLKGFHPAHAEALISHSHVGNTQLGCFSRVKLRCLSPFVGGSHR